MNRAFTLHEIFESLSPTIPDTYSVKVLMTWPDEPVNYNEFTVTGYTSLENAIVAADLFSQMDEDIKLVFLDHGQEVNYVGQQIKVGITRVVGSKNGGVRY